MNAETAEKENKPSEEVKQEKPEAEKSGQSTQASETKAPEAEKSKVSKQGSAAVHNLKVLENIEVKLTVEVGNTEIKIKDL